MTATQTGWLPDPGPARDPRPIETGGAIVVIRLTPAEVSSLARYPSLVEGLHAVLNLLGADDEQ